MNPLTYTNAVQQGEIKYTPFQRWGIIVTVLATVAIVVIGLVEFVKWSEANTSYGAAISESPRWED